MNIVFEGVRIARGGRPVLDVPDLTIAGERTTVVAGPNGAGKSSLLRVVAALDRPAAGRVMVGGDVAARGPHIRDAVAYAFQRAVFLAGSVRENLELGPRLRGVPEAERRHRTGEVAEACGIAHLLERDARRLSGGEAQRANLARALCLRAPVTLLDEPLSGLDGPGRAGMLSELPALLRQFGTTVVVVTHDMREAAALAEDLVVVADGTVRAAGPLAAVLATPPDAETAALLGYAVLRTEAEAVAAWPGVLMPGTGAATFTMVVDRAVAMPGGVEVTGRIGGTPVSVRLEPGMPPPRAGSKLAVTAPPGTLVRFPIGSGGRLEQGRAESIAVPESR